MFSQNMGYNVFGFGPGNYLQAAGEGFGEYGRQRENVVPKEIAARRAAVNASISFAGEKLLGYGQKWLGNQIIGNIGRIDKSGENHIIKIDMQFFAERDLPNQSSNALKKGMRNLEKEIEEHKDKLKNPQKHEARWDVMSEKARNGLLKHWNKEINNFYESIENRIE